MFKALRKWAGAIALSPQITGVEGDHDGLPDDKIREIKSDQIELLFKMDRASGLKPIIAFIGTTWVLDGFSSAMPWAALALYCAAWTWYHSIQMEFLASPTRREEPEHWAWMFTLASLTTGLAWGLGAVAWFNPADVANQAIVAVVILGVAASSIITRSLHTPATLAFLVPAALPLGISLISVGTTFGFLMSAFGILFVAGLFQWGHKLRSSHDETTALRYQNEALIDSLSAQTRAADEARIAAEAANKTKSQFLATMSHEVRTPLNGILGMARVLQNSDLSGEQQEQLDVIEESGEVLNTVLNDILDLSKLEAGQLEIQLENVNMLKAANSVVRLLAPGAQEKGLSINLQTTNQDWRPMALGDTHRVRQVLFNLIGNAIKFTERGDITVTIAEAGSPLLPRGAGADLPRENIVVAITDSGIGIDNKMVSTLFEPFRQADQTTTRKYGGSGLGLSICKRLTDLMGGKVNAFGTPGEGSTFWFALPTAKSQSAPKGSGRPGRPAALPTAPMVSGDGKFILLAEDNDMNAKVATTMLSKAGHKVLRTHDGEETIAWLQEIAANGQTLPDLILMDIRMPGMSGVEAAEAVRAMEGPVSRLPIIALTADISLTDFDGAGRYTLPQEYVGRFDGALPKPITLDHLTRAIAEQTGARVRPSRLPKDDPRLDTDQLNNLYSSLGPDMVVELIEAFAGDVDTIAKALNEAAQDGDTAEIRTRAHNLAGVAANLGFVSLADAARKLNRAASGRDAEALHPELKSVRAAIADAEVIVHDIKSA